MTNATDLGPVRFSHLRSYGRSAAHGLIARTKESKQTAAMQLGTAVHAMMFNTKPVCWYHSRRAGKEYDKFVADHPQHEILTEADYFKAQGMVNALRDNKVAAPLLAGEAEKQILFRWYGADCRTTPDVRGDGFVTELKTCPTSHPDRFPWHSLRMHYHAQMQFERLGSKQDIAYVVAVEYTEPFVVQCFRVTDEALEAAEKLLVSWIERLKGAEASQQWGGYTELVMPLDVPGDDVELDYGGDNGNAD